jgi:hypothetical protein
MDIHKIDSWALSVTVGPSAESKASRNSRPAVKLRDQLVVGLPHGLADRLRHCLAQRLQPLVADGLGGVVALFHRDRKHLRDLGSMLIKISEAIFFCYKWRLFENRCRDYFLLQKWLQFESKSAFWCKKLKIITLVPGCIIVEKKLDYLHM